MGLTWSQKFYQIPDEAYIVQFFFFFYMASAAAVVGLLPKDEDNEELNDELAYALEGAGYYLSTTNFSDLIHEGYQIVKVTIPAFKIVITYQP